MTRVGDLESSKRKMEERSQCQELRDELRIQKLKLWHEEPHLFVNSQFFPSVIHIGWVVFWAVYYVTMLSVDIYYNKDEGGAYFIYLTNLSYLVQAALVFSDLTVTIFIYTQRKDIAKGQSTGTPWYISALWGVYNVSNAISLLVTLLYYGLLEPTHNISSLNKHLFNSVYTLINLMVCAKPTHVLHFYQPVIYACAYLVFSVIYQNASGPAIYDPLDWDSPGKAALVSCLAALVGAPVSHLFCFALFTFRKFLASKCTRSKHLEFNREVTSKDVEVEVKMHDNPDVSTTHAP